MKLVGLMAGTSLDGIDAALVDWRYSRGKATVELLGFKFSKYSAETVKLIRECSDSKSGTVDKVALLNFYLGELFAEAALNVIKASGLRPEEIDLIGSHGQTIYHIPRPVKMGRYSIRATLQVGEPAVIAARTGIPAVADFRPADIAAGGEGAPLVPYVDYLIFRHPQKTRLMINIGGIANVTLIPAGIEDPNEILATDTGPGNMVIDELVRRMSGYKLDFDKHGRIASLGKPSHKILEELLSRKFFLDPPPKSTGRESFGPEFVESLLKKHPCTTDEHWRDRVATATALTAESIYRLVEKYYDRRHCIDEVIVSGGGSRNKTLLSMLAGKFAPRPVLLSDEFGIPADAKEAIAFAILAAEASAGIPTNAPGATGAKRPAILGKLIPVVC